MTHRLHFTWTGWPTEGSVFPDDPGAMFFAALASEWASDGIQFLSRTWTREQIQIASKVEPTVAPVLFTARIKGRLQHALRTAGSPVVFSRKVAMRAIGENLTDCVLTYLQEQLERSDLVDPRYRASLAAASIEDQSVDLTSPVETDSGRYWYNLHIVLVANGRYRIGNEDENALPRIRPAAEAWASSSQCGLRALAVMPDHVHAAVRGTIQEAPAAIAGGLRVALNRAAGCVLYSDQMYAGTFSEYSLRSLPR